MPITGMNHAVLYVRNAERTARFYEGVLDFKVLSMDPDGKYAFLNAPASHNDHDIAFFSIGDTAGPSTAGAETVGLYHLAWEVPALDDLVRLRQRLVEAGALVGESNHETHLSLYAKDPDGLEFGADLVRARRSSRSGRQPHGLTSARSRRRARAVRGRRRLGAGPMRNAGHVGLAIHG